MADETTSRRWGTAQTILLTAYAAAVVFDPTPMLFLSAASALAGSLLCTAGVLLLLTAIVTLRRVVQVAPAPREGGSLVTAGPYRWLRHPIYTAFVTIVIGLFFRRPTIVSAVAALLAIVFLLAKVRVEERFLSARYPDYAEYKRRTWGVIPGIR